RKAVLESIGLLVPIASEVRESACRDVTRTSESGALARESLKNWLVRLSFAGTMTLPATALPIEAPPAFLGVANSLTGKLWRDRLDSRGAARSLAIAQRHHLPEMLARVLAGRDVEIDAVEDFLDPTIRKLMPDPHTITQMEAAAKRIADAATRGERVAIFSDYDFDGAPSAALL